MERFATDARKLVEAAALALLATAPLYLAPPSIATRLDAWLFDVLAGSAPASATPTIAVAPADGPADVAELATAATRAGVELIVTTLPAAIALRPIAVIGPTEVASGAGRARQTNWPEGGALLFQPELDGVVRRDGGAATTLASAAAKLLGATAPSSGALLRLAAPVSLRRWDPASDVSGVRALVAGPPGPSLITPVGVVTTAELVALALDAHLAGAYLSESREAVVSMWLIALTLAVAASAYARGVAQALLWTGAGALTLGAASATAFARLDLWCPIVGPFAWLALTNALVASRRLALRAASPRTAPVVADQVARARDAAAKGQVKAAWSLYRVVPATTELLPEIYELGCALQERGADDEAAELFHRIAQTDSGFRDVARRLVNRGDGMSATEARDSLPKAIGRYELLEHIGRGAMGNVYLSRDPVINRILALKAIDLSIGYEHDGMESPSESFLREATIAGSLSHPNIVTIYDVGESEGLAYIAMEYVRGHHLSEFATVERLLPVTTVLDLVARAADALDHAHGHNIVHRDIKPANIMYDWTSNNLKITDFGIAKLIDANRTRTGIVLGTPAYMSPEQLEGRNVNGHTDLFALGVSLYQLLTGQLPFRGASMTNLMFVIANEPHESVTRKRRDLPKSLDAIVDRALAKDPANRFRSGAEMAAALRAA
jgi:hypothetical protein